MEIFTILSDWWVSSSSAFSSVVDLFSLPLSELINVDIPIVSNILNLIYSIPIGSNNLGGISLFSFLLGSFITVFISITIIKWFIDILP